MSFDRFDGRVFAITGVGRTGQVGEVVASALAARGAALALLDRDEPALRERAAELESRTRVHAVACDLTSADDATRAAREIGGALRCEIDGLINVAGGFAMSGPVADSDPAVLAKQIAINLTTAYNATRAFLPMVRARRGAIVYFASAAALPGGSGAKMAAYSAAKAGVLALMRAVAEEERDTGVRCNALAPTAIRTSDNVSAMGDKVRYVEREEIAEAVAFLCSDAARSITGQVIRLGA